jgi:hypothetical protein
MSDKVVEFQSKMLVAFLKAFKVEPSVDGLIRALRAEPETVYEAVKLAQDTAPILAETVKALHNNLPAIIVMIAETHRLQRENHILLTMLCADKGLVPVAPGGLVENASDA